MSAMTIERIDFRKVFTNIGTASVEVHITAQSGAHAAAMRIDSRLSSHDAEASLRAMEKHLIPLLKGRELSQIKEIDSELEAVAAEWDVIAPYIPAVSQAVLEAGAQAAKAELCDWLRQFCGLKGSLPMPMSGAVAAGVNFGAEPTYQGKPWWGYVATGFDNTDDAVNALWVVQRKWQDIIKQKFGVKVSVHSGNLFYPENFFPSPKELCDCLTEAISDGGFEGKVRIFADLAAGERFDAETGSYHGLLAGGATHQEHLEMLLELCRSYPIAVLIDPLDDSDSMGYARLEEACTVVCSASAASGRHVDIFDSMTVSTAIDAARDTHEKNAALIPRFSLSPGFKAMDYYTAFEVTTAFRCGMTDYANRALELSGSYLQRFIKI